MPDAYRLGGTISGLYTPDRKVYLVADHVTPGSAWRTVVHEVGVHYGMRGGAIPEKLYDVIEQHIQDQLGKDTPEGREVTVAWQSAEAAGTDPRIQTNETIAHMVQSKLAQQPLSIWSRALNALKSFAFDKLGQYLPDKVAKKLLNNQVIANLAKSATGRAAELRTNDSKAQSLDRALSIPAYNRVLPENEAVRRVIENNRINRAVSVKEGQADPWHQTKLQQFTTKTYNKFKSLLHLRENLVKQGVKLDADADPFDAVTVAQNRIDKEQRKAHQLLVDPFMRGLAERATAKGMTIDQYTEDFTNYYTAKDAIERNRRFDLEKAPLTPEAEQARQKIKEEWFNGQYTQPGSYLKALEKVVDAPGARLPGKEKSSASGISDKDARVMLAYLRKNGFTDEEASTMRPFYDATVDFIKQKDQESKRFAPEDAKRLAGLGNQYWLPSKDAPDLAGSVAMNRSPRQFTSQYRAAGGRTEGDVGQNGLLSLFQKALNSSKDVPENELTKSLYNLGRKYAEQTGIKTRAFNNEKAMSEAIKAGKGLDEAQRMTVGPNTFVHNEGKFRFAIEFPEKARAQFDAINDVSKNPELFWGLKPFGALSNIYSRGNTVWNGPFLLYNAAARDTGWNAALVGLDHGPKVLAKFLGNYFKSGGPIGALSTFFNEHGVPRNALERQRYAEESKNEFAKDWQTMATHGGDIAFDDALALIKSMDTLQQELAKAMKPGTPVLDQAKALGHLLDTVGTVQIVAPRVAAFRAVRDTLLENLGHEPSTKERNDIDREATLYARRLLDYQQTSDVGRNLNAIFAFSRIAMVSGDRLAQTFKNADGSVNTRKAAMTLGFGITAFAMGYNLWRQADPTIANESNETLANNFVFPIMGTHYKLPMAYGITRLMAVTGTMLARMYNGDTSPEDAANVIRNLVVDSALPIKMPIASHNESAGQEASDFVTALMPNIPRVFVEMLQNKNSMGQAIAPEHTNNGLKSASGWPNTPEMWKSLAESLSNVGVDVYPEQLEYLMASFGGGIGAAAMRTEKLIEGQETPFPALPSVVSHDAERVTGRKFMELEEDLNHLKAKLTYAKNQGDESVNKLRQTTPDLDEKMAKLKEIEGMKIRYGKEMSAITKNTLMSEEAKKVALKQIQESKKQEQQRITRLSH